MNLRMILTRTFPPLPPHRQGSRKQRKDKGMEGASGVTGGEGEDLAEEAEVAVEEHLVPSRRLRVGLALRPRGTSVDLGLGASGVTGGEATEGEDLAEEAEVSGDRLVPTGATVDRLTEEAGGG
jgi:hypothetical protein